MAKKKFLSHNSQLKLLRTRGITIKNGSKAKRILENENYYRIINGHKILFIDNNVGPDSYKPGTCFEELEAVYKFDRCMRSILLPRILIIENHFRSHVAYVFSKYHTGYGYLTPSNYDLTDPKKVRSILELINKLSHGISQQYGKKNPMIRHFFDQLDELPLWVLINTLSFGIVSNMFKNMKWPDKREIANHFAYSDINTLEQDIWMLSILRNCCAHEERLIYYRFESCRAHACKYHTALNIALVNGNYSNGIDDLFAAIIAIKKLISKKEFKNMLKDIEKQVTHLAKQISTIQITDVTEKMGFPSNWLDLGRI